MNDNDESGLDFRKFFDRRSHIKTLRFAAFPPRIAIKVRRILSYLEPDYSSMLNEYDKLLKRYGDDLGNGRFHLSKAATMLLNAELDEMLDAEWVAYPPDTLTLHDIEQAQSSISSEFVDAMIELKILVED